MNNRITKKHRALDSRIEKAVERAIGSAFASVLHDITYSLDSRYT